MTVSFSELVDNARKACDAVEVSEAKDMLDNPDVRFIDVRDLHELQNSGKVAGAIHASRGMLEFLIDPASPYYNKAFHREDAVNTHYVVYCMSGGRSALAAATMKEMGYPNVATLNGGFKAWCEANGKTESHEPA